MANWATRSPSMAISSCSPAIVEPNRNVFRVKKSDVDLWESEPMPVYLVLFDVAEDRAYWTYFQQYAAANGISAATMKHNTVEVLFDEG